MLIFEFCAENLTFIDKAIAAGAGRIELCDNLAVGGTTPSLGVIQEAIKLTREQSVDLCVIIRPRGGRLCLHRSGSSSYASGYSGCEGNRVS